MGRNLASATTRRGVADSGLLANYARLIRERYGADRYRLWREAGGFGISLDLHCYTPEEFQRELAGLGYLGQANERGELFKITGPRAA